MTGVPQAIKQLQVKLAAETDASVKQDIQDTLSRRQEQYKTLKNLDNAMDRAELQLENTLTALGTVYSQMLLLECARRGQRQDTTIYATQLPIN